MGDRVTRMALAQFVLTPWEEKNTRSDEKHKGPELTIGTAAQGATAPLWKPPSICFWESGQLPGGLRGTARD